MSRVRLSLETSDATEVRFGKRRIAREEKSE